MATNRSHDFTLSLYCFWKMVTWLHTAVMITILELTFRSGSMRVRQGPAHRLCTGKSTLVFLSEQNHSVTIG